jgi:hypothetical protein
MALSSSQASLPSSSPVLESDEQQISLPPLTGRAPHPPDTLSRSKCNGVVLWEDEKKELFQSWFRTTPYFKHLSAFNHDHTGRRTVKLPDFGSLTRRADMWQHFEEGAEFFRGEAKIVCKLCQKIMAHPSSQAGSTTNMVRHLKSEFCMKQGKRTMENQKSIDSHVKKVSKVDFMSCNDLLCLDET